MKALCAGVVSKVSFRVVAVAATALAFAAPAMAGGGEPEEFEPLIMGAQDIVQKFPVSPGTIAVAVLTAGALLYALWIPVAAGFGLIKRFFRNMRKSAA